MTNFPVPRREEDRVAYAGAAPHGWDVSVPRQSEESTEKLMEPPVTIADPYGWMRDMKRENPEVLDHLKAENEYTQSIIKDLEPLQKKLYEELLSSIQEVRIMSNRDFVALG
jgi:protease II